MSLVKGENIRKILIDTKKKKKKKKDLSAYRTGPGCSKLTASLVNETLKFQTLISQIC